MITFEQAQKHHLPSLVALLANDHLGGAREDTTLPQITHIVLLLTQSQMTKISSLSWG